ncbi:unnamed protein product [Sphagnum compactum]
MLCPEGGGKKFGRALRHLSGECLPRGVELTSQWGEGTFPEERKEPPGGEKVGFPGKDDDVKRIGCSTTGRGAWGSLGSIGVAFPMKGGGWGPGSGLFPRVGCGTREEVGVPGARCGVGLKKKNGIMASGLGIGAPGSPSRVNEWV